MNSNRGQNNKKDERKKIIKKTNKRDKSNLSIGFAQTVKIDMKKSVLTEFFYQTDD